MILTDTVNTPRHRNRHSTTDTHKHRYRYSTSDTHRHRQITTDTQRHSKYSQTQTTGQTDYERYIWGSHIFLTKYQTFLTKYGILCPFKKNMLTAEEQHFICPLNMGYIPYYWLSYVLGVYSFQKIGYYRIWYALPLLLTNVLLKGHTIPYLVRNIS